MHKPWLKQYPAGVPADVRTDQHPSLVAMLGESFVRHADLPAFGFMGQTLSFKQIDEASGALAAWLQAQPLVRGDRVAVMLPNVPQYPVSVIAILRAGLVAVNVNPHCTAAELAHQLKDSGAKAIVVLEHFGALLAEALPGVATPTVLVAAMGDMLGFVKGAMVNHLVRKVKKMVPAYRLPGAVRFKDAVALGLQMSYRPVAPGPDDIALLQYTGGTTAVSKGAVLLHRNLVANVLQSEAWFQPALASIPANEQLTTVCALPLHHIFGFSSNMLLGLHMGTCNLLIANPGDTAGMLKQLARQRFHSFPATDTMFKAIASHPDAGQVDWGSLKISIGGGMAVQRSTARLWLQTTGCAIVEGYGLSEASPSVTCNPFGKPFGKSGDGGFSGSIGLPLPSTELAVLDDDGRPTGPGMAGELAVRGPQVMAGYWQRPDETAKVMTADGFLRTGDIGMMDVDGQFRVVDRKKDMILVSGFNVYPSEVEDVLAQMPGVLDCAAVGVPDAKVGEAVKVVVVARDPGVTEADVLAFCNANLSGYKRPRVVEFRAGLPKTLVGKTLRRELRGLSVWTERPTPHEPRPLPELA
jgi:long-chain acyl-CoA synthetase